MTYEEQALRVIQRLAALIRRDLSYVRRGQGVEPVHRLRVACRRLHNALDVFDPLLPKSAASLDQEIRKILKSLSRARDLDVQRVYFNNLSLVSFKPQLRLALKEYQGFLAQERRSLQPSLTKIIKRFAQRKILDKVAAMPLKKRAILRKDFLSRDLRKKIHKLIKRVLAYEQDVPYLERIKELHQLRIAAKHLRYTLESCRPFFTQPLQPSIAEILKLHQVLGDLHDVYVWRKHLEAFAVRRDKRAVYAPVLEQLERQYQQTHVLFVRAWEKSRRKGFWTCLKNIPLKTE